MCEKRVWRDDQERDLRGSVESAQCVFGRVGGQVFFLSLSPPCCLGQELRKPVSKSPTGVTKVFEHNGTLLTFGRLGARYGDPVPCSERISMQGITWSAPPNVEAEKRHERNQLTTEASGNIGGRDSTLLLKARFWSCFQTCLHLPAYPRRRELLLVQKTFVALKSDFITFCIQANQLQTKSFVLSLSRPEHCRGDLNVTSCLT